MLKSRVITALVLVAIIIPMLVFGGTVGVTLLVASACSVCALELARILPGLKKPARQALAIAATLVIVLFFHFGSYSTVFSVVALFPLAILILYLFMYNLIQDTVESATQLIFVCVYCVIPLCHAVLLSKLPYGAVWTFFVIAVVCIGDVGAFFAGKYYGTHKLSSKVSPGKTVEGLFGGAAGSLVAMTVMKLFFPGLFDWSMLFKLTLLLIVFAPLGDLVASAIKRRLAVKDFGTLLPGHGGILDRADSLIMAFPIAYHFLVMAAHTAPK